MDNETSALSAFWCDLAPAANRAAISTLQALSDYKALVTVVFVHVHTLLSPPLIAASRRAILRFTTQPRDVIIKQLTIISFSIFFIYLIRRYHLVLRLKIRYRRFVAALYKQSRVAAFCLPHLLYVTAALSLHYFFARHVVPAIRAWGLPVVAFALPVSAIMRALYVVVDVYPADNNSHQQQQVSFSNIPSSSTINSNSNTYNNTMDTEVSSPLLQRRRRRRQMTGTPLPLTPATPSSYLIRRRRPSLVPPEHDDDDELLRRASDAARGIENEAAASKHMDTNGSDNENENENERQGDENVNHHNLITPPPPARPTSSYDSPAPTTRLTSTTTTTTTTTTPALTWTSSLLASAPRLRRRRQPSPGALQPLTPAKPPARAQTTVKAPRKRTPTRTSTNTGTGSLSLSELSQNARLLREECRVSKLCIVLALLWVPRSILWSLCPTVLRPVVVAYDVALFYTALWAQWSFTAGADVVYVVLTAALRRRGLLSNNSRHHSDRPLYELASLDHMSMSMSVPNEEVRQQVGFIVRLLQSLNLSRFLSANHLRYYVTQTRIGVYISALLFVLIMLTPRPLLLPAVLTVALLLPAATAVRALEQTTATTDADAQTRRQNALAYWAVMAGIELMYAVTAGAFEWIPLVLNVKLALVAWIHVHDAAPGILDAIVAKLGLAVAVVKQTAANARNWKASAIRASGRAYRAR